MKHAWRSVGAGAALIVGLTLVTYLPAIRGGFVWDDGILITDNPMIKAGDGLYRFWFTTEARDYYPLTWSAWWLQWRLWGDKATGYHVVNVLLHAGNAVLVWMVLQRLNIPGAWFAGLLFALHPVNVASAAWISEQKNTLSMFFSLIAVLFYLRFDEENRWSRYALALAAFLLALLSKSAVVMLPVALLGCLWWRHGKLRGKDFLRSAPYFALSLIFALATIWFQNHRVLEGHAVLTDGFLERLAIAGCAPWFYLSKALLPFNLSAVYPRWGPVSLLPGIVLVAGLAAFWWKRRTWGRPLFFALGYFVVMLFPVLGFFDQDFYQYSFVADPWQYYSMAGVVGLAGAIGDRMRGQPRRIAGVAVLTLLGLCTWARAGIYASEETLWRDTVSASPDSWMPHYNLGTSLLQSGKLKDAVEQFQDAARLRPDLVKVHSNLGIALARAGRLREAIEQFEEALGINPNLAEVHSNLGHALMLTGNAREAIEHWREALRINPDLAEVNCDLAQALEQTGQMDDAISHYERALALRPGMTEAQERLARLRTRR